ncbi:GNAT family N-acetyltransferase [Mucilaginibacter glaciei]|uniref:GNAT family N-acetyltransferase n=1 Tax=Mucilaginibacter glaciei TaxID=2772109 RepID=A0A926NMY0_9SPHI|nr:GNAT family N-acetyltransferase [Mucilaginibacter glaciei]MBD1392671.1 GNAT family N-acetyltransferase [Mucilaginibacter glaciei]
MTEPLFESENLAMHCFDVSDGAFIFELLNSAGWKKFIGDRSINTLADALNYINTGPLVSYQTNGYGGWMVSLKSTGDPIGMCGLFKRDYLAGPDLGFAFLPGFEGKGFAYESCLAAIKYVRDTYRLKQLYATTVEINPRSQRLLTRLGFTASGTIGPPVAAVDLLLYTLQL